MTRPAADYTLPPSPDAEAMREAIAKMFDDGAAQIIALRDASPFHSVSHDALTTYARNLSGWASQIRDMPVPALPAPQDGAGEVEKLRDALAREQSVCVEVMRERDNAEEAIGGLFREVMGRPPEWSSVFGYADALEEVADTMATVRAALTTPAVPGEDQNV